MVKIVLTGRPGSGKSTVLRKIVDMLRKRGYVVGGILCPDERGPDGRRVGFRIIDIMHNNMGWLASVNQPEGPRIGKYRVNVRDALKVGVTALHNSLREADIVVIDEVGPMELLVRDLRKAIMKALSSSKHVIAIVHHRLRDSEIKQILVDKGYHVYKVTPENRNSLPSIILKHVEEEIGGNVRRIKTENDSRRHYQHPRT